MKLSTRFRYGTRFMIDLAMSYNAGPVAMTDITNQERLSKKYLEQIAYRLMKTKLIKSVRGPKGGYLLTKHPQAIRLIDIYNALEKNLALVPCLKNPNICSLSKTCAAKEFWQRLQRQIEQYLFGCTLKSLAKLKKQQLV